MVYTQVYRQDLHHMPTTVIAARIPTHRRDQLLTLADEQGTTVSALLDDLVADAIARAGHQWDQNEPARQVLQRRLVSCDRWQHVDGGRLELNRGRFDAMTTSGLEIRAPIRIRFEHLDDALGTYRLRNDHHDIAIRSGLTPSEAARTIWHEVGHVVQTEQMDKLWLKKHLGQAFLEQDAESYADQFQHINLIRPAGAA